MQEDLANPGDIYYPGLATTLMLAIRDGQQMVVMHLLNMSIWPDDAPDALIAVRTALSWPSVRFNFRNMPELQGLATDFVLQIDARKRAAVVEKLAGLDVMFTNPDTDFSSLAVMGLGQAVVNGERAVVKHLLEKVWPDDALRAVLTVLLVGSKGAEYKNDSGMVELVSGFLPRIYDRLRAIKDGQAATAASSSASSSGGDVVGELSVGGLAG